MNILILGGGGREHALVWAVKQNPKCDRLIVAPGNAGIAGLAECAALDIENSAAVVGFATANAIDFVIIGPEAPLVAGVSDDLRTAGFWSLGPQKQRQPLKAAKISPSKSATQSMPQRRPMVTLPKPKPPKTISAPKVRRLWSKPTAWQLARA